MGCEPARSAGNQPARSLPSCPTQASGFFKIVLKLKEATDVVGLPLADDEFLLIGQRQHPAMTGDGGHLADVIGVHDGIAMHPLKAGGGQGGFDGSKSLGGEETALGGNNPDQSSLGLESENFIEIEEEVVASDAAYQFAGAFGGGDFRQRAGDFAGLAEQIPRAIDSLQQAIGADGFQKVIDGSSFEGFDGVLMKRSHDDNDRKVCPAEAANDFEAVKLGHLEIEKDEIGLEVDDLPQGFHAVVRFADEANAGHQSQFFAKYPAGDGFVVDDQRLDRSIHPYSYTRYLGRGRENSGGRGW